MRQGLLEKLLASPDHRIRAAGTYLIRFQAEGLKMPMALLKEMARDKHPRVRTELIHTVSYLQQADPAYASLLGQVDVSDDAGLKTILGDAGYGINSGKGPEIPVLQKPEESKLTHWLLREGGQEERHFVFGGKAGSFGTMRSFVRSPAKRRAILAVRHSYVKVFLNGTPVIASANWWSSDWNVQVELQEGINQIEARYVKGRGAGGYAPVYLFDPLGAVIKDLISFKTEVSLRTAAAKYDQRHGLDDATIRISAVPNQLAFFPNEFRIKAGSKVKVFFNNPDIQIHNMVIVRPGSEQEVGLLADRMAQDPDAMQRSFVPDSDKVLWSTPLVNGTGRAELELIAPQHPGNYPFICTFPGHWRVMKGVMVVY